MDTHTNHKSRTYKEYMLYPLLHTRLQHLLMDCFVCVCGPFFACYCALNILLHVYVYAHMCLWGKVCVWVGELKGFCCAEMSPDSFLWQLGRRSSWDDGGLCCSFSSLLTPKLGRMYRSSLVSSHCCRHFNLSLQNLCRLPPTVCFTCQIRMKSTIVWGQISLVR